MREESKSPKEKDVQARPEPNPVVAFTELVFAKRSGDTKLRRRAERELARSGIRVAFRDEEEAGPSASSGDRARAEA